MDILSYKLGKNASGGGGGDIDWSAIDISGTPQNIIDGYNYAKTIKQNFVPSGNMQNKYKEDQNLVYFPNVDTSTTTMFSGTFQNCYCLTNIALIDLSNATSIGNMFDSCRSLKKIPQFDTKNCEYFGYTFYQCYSLKDVPILNTSKATTLQYMFRYCDNLTNESLNNIMKMCINATSFNGTKSLSHIGLSSTQATRCQSLSNYQAFLNAGWTTGY